MVRSAMDNNNDDRLAQLRAVLAQESGDSLSLIENPADNPICKLAFDADVPCIVVQWRGYATSAQMRFVLENVIVLLERHKASYILGDDTLLPMVHTADQAWIINDWFPRAIAAGWRASANKVPRNYFGQLTTTSVQSVVPMPVVIRPFTELAEARRWLQSFAPV